MKEFIASKLPHDKLIHFFVGFFIYLGFDLFFENWISLLFVAVVAIANEVRDEYKKKGAFSWLDILFTIAPAITLILIYGKV